MIGAWPMLTATVDFAICNLFVKSARERTKYGRGEGGGEGFC